jgi:RNA polymerase subunit RPABC4/transcription elongation factor Spt4
LQPEQNERYLVQVPDYHNRATCPVCDVSQSVKEWPYLVGSVHINPSTEESKMNSPALVQYTHH